MIARLFALWVWMVAHWDKFATVLLGLLGWGLLTHVLALWVGGWGWELGLGLLALSLFGWKLAFVIARDGLYTLSRKGAPK